MIAIFCGGKNNQIILFFLVLPGTEKSDSQSHNIFGTSVSLKRTMSYKQGPVDSKQMLRFM
jgi:hypothetical protein